MRILHVVPSYLPATRYGGPIYAVHGLARAQAAQGDEAHVFTTNVDGAGTSGAPTDRIVNLDGVRVAYFSCGVGQRIYRSPDLASELARKAPDFDLLHIHSVFLWPTIAAAEIAQSFKKPYILSPRGMLAPETINAKSRLAKTFWIYVVGRKIVSRASALHVTSALEKDGVEQLGLRSPKICIVPNGVDPPPLAPRTVMRGPMVLSLGRISWKKGLDRLIESLVHVENAELVIAGNDEENLSPRLKKLAARLGLTERVRFVGPVEGMEKWSLLRAASLFVLASHSENFANVVLEAMACGVPVVVTPQVGLAAVVEAVNAGVVCEGDPSILGPTIARLLCDPVRLAALGAAGKRAAAESFSWATVAQQMRYLYLSACEKQL